MIAGETVVVVAKEIKIAAVKDTSGVKRSKSKSLDQEFEMNGRDVEADL